MTNSDPDDVQSMVRLLLYANEFDIEGLIASSATFDMVAEKKNSKLRVFLIFCQDATHQWLMNEFPDLFIIESKKTYSGMFRSDGREWAEENIINNDGPLGAIYPPRAAGGHGVIEGDTPSFLYIVSANRGINDPEDPTQPSWGGQYVRKGSTKHYVDGPGGSTISKWKTDFQAEFKERADWMLP